MKTSTQPSNPLQSQLQLSAEERFRTHFDQSPFSIQILAPDGRTLQVNQAWKKLLDVTDEFVENYILKEYNILEDRQLHAKGIIPFLERSFKGEALSVPPVFYDPADMGKTGRARWSEAFLYPVKNAEGVILEVVLIHFDVTDRVLAEQKSRETFELFRNLAEAIPHLVWSLDGDLNVEFFNQHWLDYTGVPFDEAYRSGWHELVKPRDLELVNEKWRDSIAQGETFEAEFRMRRHDGVYRWFLCRAVALKDAQGKIVRWFGTNTDIHDRKQTQEALSKAIQARDEFLSIASHELNTPITSLILQFEMASKLLERNDPKAYEPERLKKLVQSTNRQLSRMGRLIEDMLEVSRASLGRMSMNFEAVQLDELIREVVDRFADQLRGAGTEVEASLDPQLNVQCDRDRIEQVLTNLLTNAGLKYAAGKPIVISSSLRDGKALLCVKDHGIGIAEEDFERIFNRFERAISHDSIAGMGLGLYICRQIVEAHGGSIKVESQLGQGSTFSVVLPLTHVRS